MFWYFSFSGVVEFLKRLCSFFAFGFFAFALGTELGRFRESPRELFDVELQPLSSPSDEDFFDSLSVLSESETLSTTTQPEVAVALPGELFDVELQPLSSPDFFDLCMCCQRHFLLCRMQLLLNLFLR
jgi:hypothetical protein